MQGPGHRQDATPRVRRLSVVVVGDGSGGLARTVSFLAHEHDVEVLPVVPWPARRGPDLTDLPHALRSAGVGEAAAANAGIAAASADRVLLLRAGDEPRPGTIAAHLQAEGVQAGRVAARRRQADPVTDGWSGVHPVAGLPPAGRFTSLERRVLLDAGGLDDRLRDLDVAAHDLLARLRDSGIPVTVRDDLVVDAAGRSVAEQRRAAVRAGAAAHALAVLHLRRGASAAGLRERLERIVLAWAEPVVVPAAALTAHRVPFLERTALRAAFARGRGLPPLPLGEGDRLGPPSAPASARPAVAVVVPFAGDASAAADLLDALECLERRPGDDVVVVDNAREPVVRPRAGIRVVRADAEWSSYHARNVGWRTTTTDWILFMDADCRPVPWLLDAYFAPAPAAATGAVAGDVLDAPGHSLAERYSRAVGVLRQSSFLAQEPRGFAATANLLVRRTALDGIGGFAEGVRSSGDADASHRLGDAGWDIEHRPRAAVLHLHRATLRGVARQYRRYAAGVAWLRTRYPEVGASWPPHALRPLSRVPLQLAAGRFGLALLHLVTAWTMWRARGVGPEANLAERPAGEADPA